MNVTTPFASTNCSSTVTLIYTTVIMTDLSIGVPSNIWMLWLLVRSRGGLLSANIFLFQSGLTELIMCPILIACIITNVTKMFNSVLGAMFGLVMISRPLVHCCICLERYVAVVHPITFLKYKAVKYRVGCMAGLYMVIMGICAVESCIQIPYIYAIVFFPILATDSFCCFSILQSLRKPRPGDGEREMNLMKRKAFKTVLVIQVMMMVNYLPLVIVAPVKSFHPQNCYYQDLFSIIITALVIGSFVHPFMYFSRVGKFPCNKE